MERPTKVIVSALVINALFFGLAIAQQVNRNNMIDGPVDEDLYYEGSTLFYGTKIPEVRDGSSGTSTYDLEGAGSVTVGSQKNGGFPRLTVFGGTTITSDRVFDEEDVNHAWWEGEFFSPQIGSTNISVDGTDSPNGDDIARFIVEKVYEFGEENETFNFSPAATLVMDVGLAISDDVPLYVAYRDSADSTNYTLKSEDVCWVKSGYCIVDITSANSIALVREVFEKCPARNEIPNGLITGAPNCVLQCDRGYEPDEKHEYCLKSEGGGGAEGGSGEVSKQAQKPLSYESDVVYPAGYFKYRETRSSFGRQVDTEGLSGKQKQIAGKINASNLFVAGGDTGKTPEQVKIAQQENDNFLNYMLALRGLGKKQESAKLKIDDPEVKGGDMNKDNLTAEDQGDSESLYGSAPLLPSTGPALFWVLAAVGLGMMAFAARNRN